MQSNKLLLVMPAHAPIEPPSHLPSSVVLMRRPSDFHWGRLRARLHFVLWGLQVARAARRYSSLVVLHPGLELVVLGLLVRRTQVTVVDFLIPRSQVADRLPILRRFQYRVLRRGDTSTLQRRFGIPAENISFLPCPAPCQEAPSAEQGYGYSAGWAHRDWPTLAEAQRLTGLDIRVAAAVSHLPGLTSLGPLSPEDGREVMRSAQFVVLPLMDTELPSGPLVLLDAMAHGKAIVVTEVRGSRDYVTDGVDALVVPPGDSEALAAALRRLDGDSALRHQLGLAARKRARLLSPLDFWAECLG